MNKERLAVLELGLRVPIVWSKDSPSLNHTALDALNLLLGRKDDRLDTWFENVRVQGVSKALCCGSEHEINQLSLKVERVIDTNLYTLRVKPYVK